MEVLSPTTYRLQLPDTYLMHLVVNIQHLTKYHRSPDKTRNILENPRDQLRSSEEYKVEKIVAEGERAPKPSTWYDGGATIPKMTLGRQPGICEMCLILSVNGAAN